MKKILTYIMLFTLALWSTGCSLESAPTSSIPTDNAFDSPQDVLNGMHGAYNSVGGYKFWGRNVVAIGDMSTDISLASASSGHFVAINGWSINEDNSELTDAWTIGYEVIDRSTRAINGAKELIAHPDENRLSDSDIMNLHNYCAQLYSLRSLSHFTLVNIFSLPYRASTENSQLGIVLVDEKPIEAFEQISRATVKQTYDQILKDIASAKEHFGQLSSANKLSVSQYYMNEAALYALEARVKLYMQNYVGAAAAAERAIELRASADISNEDYVAMWSSVAISDEDIFTIAKSSADNLSANSLNTLYNSYGGSITQFVKEKFGANDARLGLISVNHPEKFDCIPSAQAVSNIPVFRKSEMYLIAAESYANLSEIDNARAALLYTAKRDSDINSINDLPNTKEALLSFIEDERIREFFQEGHRMYDLRRTGKAANIGGNSQFIFANFVYPIPVSEINAGFGVVQNPNWHANLP
ncbi:MAG: RagB/SusD family nutrient uptake outer membrane protein [Bacteroidales bacterium]|nr:RagB/SusD family nutrient uptake outer membrane protein [Bacteroidales bacterium]